MTIKMIAIAVLALLMIGLLVLYRRPARKPPRLGQSAQGSEQGDGSSVLIAASLFATAEGHRAQGTDHHASPAHHSPHHGGVDAGSHSGGFDGGGGGGGGDGGGGAN